MDSDQLEKLISNLIEEYWGKNDSLVNQQNKKKEEMGSNES